MENHGRNRKGETFFGNNHMRLDHSAKKNMNVSPWWDLM